MMPYPTCTAPNIFQCYPIWSHKIHSIACSYSIIWVHVWGLHTSFPDHVETANICMSSFQYIRISSVISSFTVVYIWFQVEKPSCQPLLPRGFHPNQVGSYSWIGILHHSLSWSCCSCFARILEYDVLKYILSSNGLLKMFLWNLYWTSSGLLPVLG